MKIAQKKPAVVKSVVRGVDGSYEAWYSKPISLGPVFNRGGYWYTQDGMRFVSNRDALEYLIRRYDAAAPVSTEVPEGRAVDIHTEAVRKTQKPAAAEKYRPKTVASKKIVGATKDPNPVVPSKDTKKQVEGSKPSLVQTNDPFIRELLEYLRHSPEVQKILKEFDGDASL